MIGHKHCPFCGSDDIRHGRHKAPGCTERFFIMCADCSAKIERTSESLLDDEHKSVIKIKAKPVE